MAAAGAGDAVKVHYTGTLEDGSEFDSSVGRDPLAFTLGEGSLIQGFERAVLGMTEGEKKTINIPSDEGYGAHRPEMVQKVARSTIPPQIEIREGLRLQAEGEGGQPVALTVTAFDDDEVTLDANHPLAGKDLTFEIELVEVTSKD